MKQFKIKRLTQPLPLIARDKIEELIQNKTLAPGDRLPKETKLAQMLGVSRITVREALRLLEEDGIITRRQGRGTFVRSSDLIIRNPLEVNISVTEVIESKGFKAGTAWFKLERTKADKTIARGVRSVDRNTRDDVCYNIGLEIQKRSFELGKALSLICD